MLEIQRDQMNYAAKTIQDSARNGFRRLQKFRATRLLFIRDYIGPYYDKDYGNLGSEPLNLAFTAIRALVPNLVTRNPHTVVGSDYIAYRPYGELLGIALDYLAKKIDLPSILQRGIVDAIFTMGIFKVGLSTSDSLIYFGEEAVDPGQLYVETVDLDNFTFDPDARQLEAASFLGERIRVERDLILESGEFKNDLIETLPSSAELDSVNRKGVRNLSTSQINARMSGKLHDYIDLMELYLPDPNVIVTLPYNSSVGSKFLREETFFGPSEGPYTFLSLTPPVPSNPIPVQLAGVWHDMHTIGNRITKKILDQAEAQKDILGYQGQSADSAQEIVDAKNLEAIRMDNPDGAKMFSFGGQNPRNEQMIARITQWFDQVSGNTSMLGGTSIDTNVATVANIMNQNATTGVTYMRDQVYRATQKIQEKCAWYLHTDPLVKLPLIRRETIPPEYDITDEEIRMVSPARVQEIQVFLTPEVRRGDFIDFAFEIEHDSMAPINWQTRLQQLEILAVKIIPAAASAAQISAQMGHPFSFQRFITRIAKLMNLEWIDEIWQSPELTALLTVAMRQGPQPAGNQGISSGAAVRQNGGSVTGNISPSDQTQQRQTAQVGADRSQADQAVREI